MPAKRIIVLDKTGPSSFNYLLWADVPAGREAMWLERQGNPTASVWQGASAAENTAISTGTVVEQREDISKPGASQPDMEAEVETRWNIFQNRVTTENPWNRYGTYWDDSEVWNPDGVS
jgi:hypothetical protein